VVVGLVREMYRVAREGDSDIGHQVETADVTAKVSGANTSCGPSNVKTPLTPASRKARAVAMASVGPDSAVKIFTAAA
jgi:hypothetical protein